MNTKTLIFTLIDVSSKGASFVMMPIFLKLMTDYQFGLFELYLSYLSGISILVSLGLSSYFQAEMVKRPKGIIDSFVNILFVSFFIMLFLVFIFSYLFYTHKIDRFYFVSIPIVSFLVVIYQIVNVYFLQKKDFMKTTILNLLNIFSLYSISIVLLYFFKLGDVGRFIGVFISSLFVSIISLFFFFRENKLVININLNRLKIIIKYGVTLIPHLYSGWIKNGGERILIASSLTVTMLTSYSVGLKLAMIVTMFFSSLISFITPSLFYYYDNFDLKSVNNIYIKYVIFSLISHVLWFLFIVNFSYLFIAPSSGNYLMVFKVAIVNSFFISLYMIFSNKLFFLQKSKLLGACSIIATLVFIIALFIFKHKSVISVESIVLSNLISSILLLLLVLYFVFVRKEKND